MEIAHRIKGTQHCLFCNSSLLNGRSDKKYCDDHCRAAYNTSLKRPVNNTVRNINSALSKNRRILESVLGNSETAKIKKASLVLMGYNFKYFTSQYHSPNGKTYIYCYDLGYLLLENEVCLIVQRKD